MNVDRSTVCEPSNMNRRDVQIVEFFFFWGGVST